MFKIFATNREGAKMVPEDQLTSTEKEYLLKVARQALQRGVAGEPLLPLDEQALTPRLRAPGASFVTLTWQGMLRGCIGTLEPYQSLVEDVREHAVAAALQDYRFPPVQIEEVNELSIEISRLTIPKPLDYTTPEDLVSKLHPGVDGVVLRDGMRRATFLPQVWEKIPDPAEFLDHLCMKMGASPNLWRRQKVEVLVYRVEEFHE
jgi:AmmeMemoRadiSam system protein A